jgi:3',5'-cyclic AMP phosphodiesterase CpdA
VTFGSALGGCASTSPAGQASPSSPPRAPASIDGRDLVVLQLSDLHWGYDGPANPEPKSVLPRALDAIRAMRRRPDLAVVTGDLIHKAADGGARRARLAEVVGLLRGVPDVDWRLLPGEHDAADDAGEAFREVVGPTHWSLDRGGVHFVGLDNVSDPGGGLGEAELRWLADDLRDVPSHVPLTVFAHRPLFDLAPEWDWRTVDGDQALALFAGRPKVTVFYGHIHQSLASTTGTIRHFASRSLVFPLPAPKSRPKREPLPWDATDPTHGLGMRAIHLSAAAVEGEDLGPLGEVLREG